MCDTNELGYTDPLVVAANPFSLGAGCNPFRYKDSAAPKNHRPVPYYHALNPPVDKDDPLNHCIYSLWGRGQAEILSYGRDDKGTFILWKVYTEWSNAGPMIVNFSKTGLGYMLMMAFIKRGDGDILCFANDIVKVDCCLKDAKDRPLTLWWESTPYPTCIGQSFMFYGDGAWCEVPERINLSQLFGLAMSPGYSAIFFVFPELFGTCVPIEWTIEGPGSLSVSKPLGVSAEWSPPSDDYVGCDEIKITAKDRCGSTDTVIASCCKQIEDEEIEIQYTSLVMGCNQYQDLNATGCPPFSWTLSGGGTLSFYDSAHKYAQYHSPATNPNCTSNPTFTVSDCCGKSATLSLAVNCYTGGAALSYGTYQRCGSCWCFNTGCNQGFRECVNYIHYGYDCNGDQTCTGESHPCDSTCTDPPGQGEQYPYYVPATCGQSPFISWPPTSCYVGCAPSIGPCNTLVDDRTKAMKTNGCCPLNPITGLPF
jgi:hypothetical protein